MQCGNEELPTSSEAQKWPSLDTKIPGSNRILSNKKVGVELINPWRIAFELKQKVGGNADWSGTKNAPCGGGFQSTSLESGLLERCLNFLNENPDFEL